jgi:RNA polymerase sigma-70 factor, ECF subfamily
MTSTDELRWRGLMIAAQLGDSVAYTALLSSLLPVLRSFVRRRIRDSVASEDVVQEILVSLHKARDTYDPSQPLAPWLFSLARHRIVDEYRMSGRRASKETLLENWDSFESEPYSAVETHISEANPELAAALERIPPRQREAVLLLKNDDLSVKEAALRMKVSESSLKVLAHRGYNALRLLLTKEP